MTVLLWLIGVYVLSYVVVMFVNLVDEYSITKTIFLILFIPFVILWKCIEDLLLRVTKKLYQARLKKDFNITNVMDVGTDKRTQFLFADNYARQVFVIWLYVLFGIKLKPKNK